MKPAKRLCSLNAYGRNRNPARSLTASILRDTGQPASGARRFDAHTNRIGLTRPQAGTRKTNEEVCAVFSGMVCDASGGIAWRCRSVGLCVSADRAGGGKSAVDYDSVAGEGDAADLYAAAIANGLRLRIVRDASR